MTYICYRGIEVSANFQKVLLGIELTMLFVLSIVGAGEGGLRDTPGSIHPALSWFNPFQVKSFSTFTEGIILMVFIYWGWDTAVAVNEETKDKNKTPGRAAILSTLILLVTYALVITSIQAFAGIGTTGNGLGNTANTGDVLSVQGNAIFGSSGFGPFFVRPAVADDPQLGGRLHPDHDPAHRPDHAVDGGLQGHPLVIREDSPALPDADRVHDRHGRHLDRGVRGDELLSGTAIS